jgi:hypothetical protein
VPQPAFHIPRLRTLARHAVPHVVEGTLVPLALFYGALWLLGTWGALAVALGWSYLAILRRVVLRRRIPGLVVLGALTLTVRTIVSIATGSVFLYFLQPTLGTVAMAGAFLLSVPAGRPLAARLAQDFLPMPPSIVRDPTIRRVFARITLLWAFVLLANAAITLSLLLTQPLEAFLLAKTLATVVLTGAAVAVSTSWFRRSMRRRERAAEAAAA